MNTSIPQPSDSEQHPYAVGQYAYCQHRSWPVRRTGFVVAVVPPASADGHDYVAYVLEYPPSVDDHPAVQALAIYGGMHRGVFRAEELQPVPSDDAPPATDADVVAHLTGVLPDGAQDQDDAVALAAAENARAWALEDAGQAMAGRPMSAELALAAAAAAGVDLVELDAYVTPGGTTYTRQNGHRIYATSPEGRRAVHDVLWAAGHGVAPYPDSDHWSMPNGYDVVIVNTDAAELRGTPKAAVVEEHPTGASHDVARLDTTTATEEHPSTGAGHRGDAGAPIDHGWGDVAVVDLWRAVQPLRGLIDLLPFEAPPADVGRVLRAVADVLDPAAAK